MSSPWQGGDNFYLYKRGSNNRAGGTHSGSGSSKNPAVRKSGRFNPNPTRTNHPNCQVAQQAARDKKAYDPKNRPAKWYKSSLIK